MINQSTPTINHFSATVKLEELSDSLEFMEDQLLHCCTRVKYDSLW